MKPFMQKLGLLFVLFALPVTKVCLADGMEISPSMIAGGSPKWVANSGDKSMTDAMVDIGTMRQIGDALVVDIRWPYLPESYGPDPVEKDRIICRTDHAISFSVEDGFVSADGQYHVKQAYDPARQREKAERQDSEMAKFGGGFS